MDSCLAFLHACMTLINFFPLTDECSTLAIECVSREDGELTYQNDTYIRHIVCRPKDFVLLLVRFSVFHPIHSNLTMMLKQYPQQSLSSITVYEIKMSYWIDSPIPISMHITRPRLLVTVSNSSQHDHALETKHPVILKIYKLNTS